MEVAPLTSRLAEELGRRRRRASSSCGWRQAPASRAGIEPGDIILTVNGQKISDGSQLVKLIADAPIGGTVAIDVLRDGRRRSFKVVVQRLEERPRTRRRREVHDRLSCPPNILDITLALALAATLAAALALAGRARRPASADARSATRISPNR